VDALVVIRPSSPIELGLYGDGYDALIETLAARGLDVRLERPVERRSGGITLASADVAIYVGELLADHLLDIILGAAIAELTRAARGKRKRRGRRVVAIFGPSGELLRDVEIPSGTEPGPDDV
jgi:hypothetical protein